MQVHNVLTSMKIDIMECSSMTITDNLLALPENCKWLKPTDQGKI